MNPFEFVITIIVLSFVYSLVHTWMKRRAGSQTDAEQRASSQLLARLGEIEERVRVLERIVTDDRSDLKRQFKDLEG